ncbi:uncharacterized protein LOC143182734 [Calliopsis andreniformis]|uniref:uncharacterized protein LOC143182734 n=1 Tax=Calliopsis andreniformis TaxID=337506 RepID=UPI003FCDF41B
MYISTNSFFESKNFVIYTFYDKKTCFCWNEDKLVIFPYLEDNSTPVEVLTAPAPIRSIQCFTNRIFIICIPQGIYKLSREREFAVLSKSAVGMGTVFYEVLIPKNKYLYLDNKQNMTSKLLFQLSSEKSDSSKLCIYPVNKENAMDQFISTLTNNDSTIENLCVIVDEKKVFVLFKETVHIIYNSIYFIRNAVPVQNDSKIAGLLFLTDVDTIILMHSKNNTLSFEKISVGINVKAICANFSQLTEDTLWFVCSDESKLYYGKKQLFVDDIQRIRVQDKNFACLQCYDSKIILGLTANKQLIEFFTDAVERRLSEEHDTFINLHPDMLKGTKVIMDKIYKGSQELHALNETLITKEDKLRRINLYAHKHKVRIHPKISINKIVNKLFLSARFPDALPKNSWVIVNVRLDYQNLFSMNKIVDQEVVVDIQIPEHKAISFLQCAIDLVTLKEEGHSWCLIRNYVISPFTERNRKKKTRSNKIDFINSKIAMLRNLIKEGNIDMKKLSEIKESVRKISNA